MFPLKLAKAGSVFSLTPGFSPVTVPGKEKNRFNGFPAADKPLKRLVLRAAFHTRLKPGVNKTNQTVGRFFEPH
jgi:hypothetical protein